MINYISNNLNYCKKKKNSDTVSQLNYHIWWKYRVFNFTFMKCRGGFEPSGSNPYLVGTNWIQIEIQIKHFSGHV